jgi:hypothetical protein
VLIIKAIGDFYWGRSLNMNEDYAYFQFKAGLLIGLADCVSFQTNPTGCRYFAFLRENRSNIVPSSSMSNALG